MLDSLLESLRPWQRAVAAVALALALGSLGQGCSTDATRVQVAGKCALNTDCDALLVCSFGVCHAQCAGSKDCNPGQRCVKSPAGNVCQLVAESTCLRTSQCDPPLVCAVDEKCRNQCDTDRDCLSDQICAVGGFCGDPAEIDSNRKLIDATSDSGSGMGSGGAPGSGGAGGKPGGGGSSGASAGGGAGALGADASTSCPVCTASDACHLAGTCDSTSGTCSNPEEPDGHSCGANKTCSQGICCASGTTSCAGTCVDTKSDGANCGACGHGCLTGKCSAGQCQSWVVATTSGSVNGLVSDGKSVVWIDAASTSILQKPVSGIGSPITISSQTTSPVGLGMANGVIVFSTVNAQSTLDVWTATEGAANSGYNMTTVGASGSFIVAYALAIHPSGGTAYIEIDDFATGQGSIQKCTLGLAGTCGLLVPATPSDLGDDMVANASYLFWTVDASGDVARYSYSDSMTTNVATGQGGAYVVAADSNYVYFANRGANSFLINRASQTNPIPASPGSVLSNTVGTLNALATDGKYVYYGGSFGAARLGYVPASGGTGKPLYTTTIGAGTIPSRALVAAGGAIYFYDSTDKTIRGIAAPP
jgi:hypothetical protein